MKLIEKKCPNCGANLEFDENAKSCKCQYCKRSFEIERDMNDVEKFNLIYNKIQKPITIMFLLPFIIFIVIVAIIIISIISFNRNRVIDNNSIFEEFRDEIVDKENLLTNVNEISNRDIDIIESRASSEINHIAEGVRDGNHSFSIDGDIKREKLYVLYHEKSNYVILIFSATYKDFFHQEDRKTVYIPVIFQDIEKEILTSLGNARIEAPTYYLTDDQSTYTYGYSSIDEAYAEVIQPYAEEYNITEK